MSLELLSLIAEEYKEIPENTFSKLAKTVTKFFFSVS